MGFVEDTVHLLIGDAHLFAYHLRSYKKTIALVI
jgi:hypothetical protein